MLIFIPKIYDDEILYSIMARYHYLSGNLNYKETIRDFFNSDTVVTTIGFPSLLENLSYSIPKQLKYDSDFFINQCTLFPIYNPFIPEERKKEVLFEMKHCKGNKISGLLGVQAGHILDIKKLRYCPLCAMEEFENYSEVYFHRVHQIEGVYICSKHQCIIKEYNPNGYFSKVELLRPEIEKLDLNIEYENDINYNKHLYLISKSYEYLLSNKLYNFNNNLVHDKYIKYLDSMGLLTSSKRIMQKKLADEFVNFYGEKLLKKLNCTVDVFNESNWLKNITRKQTNIVHPLRHILFINFLCGDIQNFFNYEIEFYPFGKGPWPCLNIASEHYKINIVSECIITSDYKTRKPVGTFKCSCGFVYSRKGPDLNYEDRFKIGRIKKFGYVWEQKLSKLIIQGGYTLTDLSKAMNCDPKTIAKYADKLGIKNKLNTRMVLHENRKIDKIKLDYENIYKDEIIEYIRENSNISRTEIRENMNKQYTWLYRNNKDWLLDNLPVSKNKQNIDFKSSKRVNWIERDIALCHKIEEEYEKMICSDDMKRLTKSLIGQKIGQSNMLYKYIDKLPKTSKILDQICESIEEFQIKRLKKVANDLYKGKGYVRRWELVRIAGISKKYEIKLNTYIDNILSVYDQVYNIIYDLN